MLTTNHMIACLTDVSNYLWALRETKTKVKDKQSIESGIVLVGKLAQLVRKYE